MKLLMLAGHDARSSIIVGTVAAALLFALIASFADKGTSQRAQDVKAIFSWLCGLTVLGGWLAAMFTT